jgi:hypothetical protein
MLPASDQRVGSVRQINVPPLDRDTSSDAAAIHDGIGSRAWHLIVSVFAALRSFLALLLAVISMGW